jgi:SNF family Na+-dependent transporter
MNSVFFRLFLFAAVSLSVVLLFNLIVNRGFKKFQLSRAFLWISAVAMIGVVGEIFVDL